MECFPWCHLLRLGKHVLLVKLLNMAEGKLRLCWHACLFYGDTAASLRYINANVDSNFVNVLRATYIAEYLYLREWISLRDILQI